MPQRQRIRRFSSVEIQGEDSWVEVSRLTVGEAREAGQLQNDPDLDSFEAVSKMYQEHIFNWNWVNDDGEPLPLPVNDPGVIDKLTDLEFSFLGNCVAGSEEAQKN